MRAAQGAMEGGFRSVKWTDGEMAGGRGDRLEVLTGHARRAAEIRAQAGDSGVIRHRANRTDGAAQKRRYLRSVKTNGEARWRPAREVLRRFSGEEAIGCEVFFIFVWQPSLRGVCKNVFYSYLCGSIPEASGRF